MLHKIPPTIGMITAVIWLAVIPNERQPVISLAVDIFFKYDLRAIDDPNKILSIRYSPINTGRKLTQAYPVKINTNKSELVTRIVFSPNLSLRCPKYRLVKIVIKLLASMIPEISVILSS